MSLRRNLALVATIALSTGLIACGGDDSSSSGDKTAATPPLSKKSYIEKVNGAQADFQADAAELNLADPESAADFQKSLDQLVVNIGTLVDRLETLEPPTSVASEHAELVSALEDYSALIEDHKGALDSGDGATVREAALKIGEGSTEFSTAFDRAIDAINRKLS
jgi:hypothetical protein